MSIQSRTLEPHVEAFGAACPPFRFPLQSLDSLEPIADVVICIHVLNSYLVAEFLVLRFPQFVFTLGMYVRVVKEDGRLDGGFQQGLQHLALARSTARMKKYPGRPPRCFQLRSDGRIHDIKQWQLSNEMAIGYSVADSALRSRAIRSEMAIEGALPSCRIEYISVRIGISTPESRHFSKKQAVAE